MAAAAWDGCRPAAATDSDSGADPVTVVRFCGTTPGSSSAAALLSSVNTQIARAYGQPEADPEASASLEKLSELFAKLMACASAARPLRIALDSLDQLTDEGGGLRYVGGWLPSSTPPHCALVVSVLKDEQYGIRDQLQKRLQDMAGPAPAVGSELPGLEVNHVAASEGASMVDNMLAEMGRRVTGGQRKALLSVMAPAEGGGATALQLKLLAGEAAKWRSWDVQPAGGLPTTAEGLIDGLYARMEVEHGPRLVPLILGLLAVRRGGVSTEALIDAVSACDDVLGTKYVKTEGFEELKGTVFEHGEPPVRRLPPMAFSMLRSSLGAFIVERGGPGGTTYFSFYHRQVRAMIAWGCRPPACHVKHNLACPHPLRLLFFLDPTGSSAEICRGCLDSPTEALPPTKPPLTPSRMSSSGRPPSGDTSTPHARPACERGSCGFWRTSTRATSRRAFPSEASPPTRGRPTWSACRGPPPATSGAAPRPWSSCRPCCGRSASLRPDLNRPTKAQSSLPAMPSCLLRSGWPAFCASSTLWPLR